ncbi:MAG: phosphate signaling complex protein PhoU [Firmicutes bacterium]|nr:phosphate signaling complex protein PhoU [Bacillota bacterium]
MSIRNGFNASLHNLHLDVVEMASLVEYSIDETILALQQNNRALAQKVVAEDDKIDKMERIVENQCIHLIATQQPLAKELRRLMSILKMMTDFERIADHAADICELLLELTGEGYVKPLKDIAEMAVMARNMVKNATDAYINDDITMAVQISATDSSVDDYFDTVVADLQEMMRKNPAQIKQATTLIFIAKHVEKIGDHATNLGELVSCMISGKK